ncbi:MAG: hypothetical protein K9H14_07855 [Actinomycetia bacterium]|nr:hypothetical protein [Actinomycetes bacterium]
MKYSNKHFGQALHEQIKSKNIKLRSLANKTNLNYSYFSKLTRKSKPPPVETMEIIASGLDIAPDYFLEYRLHKLNQLLTSYPSITDQVISYAHRLASKEDLKIAEEDKKFTKKEK